MIKTIKKHQSQIKIVIGGPHCALFPEKSLIETGADICVQGDGELVITDIKKAINGKISFSKISGIYYKENNKIKKSANLQLIKDLDSIPFPSRRLVKNYVYGRQFKPKMKQGEFTSIITSRGCPFNCKFCSRNSISMKKFRQRSTRNIVEEINEINNLGYRIVSFVDDNFLANKKLAIQLFESIISEKIKMKFIATAVRVDSADEKLFSLMKKAGVTHLQFGLESGNQEVLDFYNKKTNLKKIRNAVLLSNKMGFFTIGTFILGAPFETKKHFQKTINFAKSLPLDSVSFLPLKYVTGSELWCKAVKEEKISEYEYSVYADSKRNLGLYTYEELTRICNKAHREFYLRLSFILRLFIKSLKNDDFGFLQSYLSLFFSNIFGTFRFLGFSKKTTFYDS
ncbi:MAG: hypothetical protein BV457_01450 [Thermoplasmata archaeon M9B1D]|nr:MAG: hypothetical protein BV457_01450 [Thermoplasmata archaeon M9B1D]PNX51321.1 MAG: hypothetical protein BV456_03680 [Thermoplasmata archaeon M8B2D]